MLQGWSGGLGDETHCLPLRRHQDTGLVTIPTELFRLLITRVEVKEKYTGAAIQLKNLCCTETMVT
jgi:hypothetical protein